MNDRKRQRILISGWFSFESPHNTAGDLLAKQSAVSWATKAGFSCDVAVPTPSSSDEIATTAINPSDYTAMVFACGPVTASLVPFLRKFVDIKRIALNVSIVPTADLTNEFDIIIPRDSPEVANPDISLASRSESVPVIGLIYVGRQKEYPDQQHRRVEEMVESVVNKIGAAVVKIDTKLPYNEYGLTTIAQVESMIRHMDIVITTRLHGSVLALRNSVPPIAIDSVPGGAKVLKQMRALNWPLVYTVDTLNKERLEEAVRMALTEQSSQLAATRTKRALIALNKVEIRFIEALKQDVHGK